MVKRSLVLSQVFTFKEKLKLPSVAAQALVDGLKLYNSDPNFAVRIHSYGGVQSGVCYGCLATCCIQQACQVRLSPDIIGTRLGRAKACKVLVEDLEIFEGAIEKFRTGECKPLLTYFRKGHRHNKDWDGLVNIWDNFQDVSTVENLIKIWKEMKL